MHGGENDDGDDDVCSKPGVTKLHCHSHTLAHERTWRC